MKKIVLIRHAESESNIGGVYEHQNVVKITENGKEQAESLAMAMSKPDEIICSKYIRTIETADPLIRKYEINRIQIWMDIHEFHPIDSVKNKDITTKKRDLLHRNYWEKLNPHFNDGGDAESFIDFVNRVNASILEMKKILGVNYIITHTNYIRCAVILLEKFSEFNKSLPANSLYADIMSEFTQSYLTGDLIIGNTNFYDLTEKIEVYSDK